MKPQFVIVFNFSLFLFFFETHTQAKAQALQTSNGLAFHVVDSVSGESLPGVRITIKVGLDSGRLVSDAYGRAVYPTTITMDSVEVITHHLAYITKSIWVRVPRLRSS